MCGFQPCEGTTWVDSSRGEQGESRGLQRPSFHRDDSNGKDGDDVELGHFVEVIALIITMMAARRLMDWLFDRLGTDDGPVAA
jgi:hypothetical protein